MTRWQRLSKRAWVRWAFEGLLLITVILAIGYWQTRNHVRGLPLTTTLRPLEGGSPVPLAAQGGKPTLVAFWAPWCGVCKMTSRNVGWARKLVGSRAEVVSVASAYDDLAEVHAYVQAQGVSYPVLLGTDDLTRSLKVEAFPTFYFLDGEGRVKGSAVGYTSTLGLVTRLLLF